ncbi:MAG TPA: GatB/YqeY domain-containing protein [Geobacteraceae bacterium]|nr:GatB/YqeY domain-containing protein [Geobacteraceae bacterium]
MMLRDRLVDEMKTAMKARDDIRVSAIRMVRSAVKNREIELGKDLDDREVTEVIASLVKQRRESIRLFQEAGRNDLVTKEERELAILLDFLPEQLDPVEIAGIVEKAIAASGAQGLRDMGKVMKIVMPQVSGRADGNVVGEIVRGKLS